MSEKAPNNEQKPRFTITHDEAIASIESREHYLLERKGALDEGFRVWKIKDFDKIDSDLSGITLHYYTPDEKDFSKGKIHGNDLDGWDVYTLSWEDEGFEDQEHATKLNSAEPVPYQRTAELLLEGVIDHASKSR